MSNPYNLTTEEMARVPQGAALGTVCSPGTSVYWPGDLVALDRSSGKILTLIRRVTGPPPAPSPVDASACYGAAIEANRKISAKEISNHYCHRAFMEAPTPEYPDDLPPPNGYTTVRLHNEIEILDKEIDIDVCRNVKARTGWWRLWEHKRLDDKIRRLEWDIIHLKHKLEQF